MFGYGVTVNSKNSTAIGYSAKTNGEETTALGASSKATGTCSVALGAGTEASGENSIAIGTQAQAEGENGIAIGSKSSSKGSGVAIGANAVAADNEIVLGTSEQTTIIQGNVVIDGTLKVKGHVLLGENNNSVVAVRMSEGNTVPLAYNRICKIALGQGRYVIAGGEPDALKSDIDINFFSDRRLKNVGEKYTAGLDELKKLEFFHYTFKKDEIKTPHVGVMAQDLQKVFPDAVTKGDDGFLRIRLEDMFYAVINAVKELDVKISQITTDIKSIKASIKTQQDEIETLKKENAELKAELKNLEKRIKG